MEAGERELLTALVNRVLRHPDEAKDIDAERAVQRLVAARPDATYLLLQRALVLEVALARVRGEVDRLRNARADAGQAADDAQPLPARVDGPAAAAAVASAVGAALPARGFLRDAAVISAGVLGGSLLVRGAESLFEADAGTGIDLDLDGLF
jgi:hypothetical protein